MRGHWPVDKNRSAWRQYCASGDSAPGPGGGSPRELILRMAPQLGCDWKEDAATVYFSGHPLPLADGGNGYWPRTEALLDCSFCAMVCKKAYIGAESAWWALQKRLSDSGPCQGQLVVFISGKYASHGAVLRSLRSFTIRTLEEWSWHSRAETRERTAELKQLASF